MLRRQRTAWPASLAPLFSWALVSGAGITALHLPDVCPVAALAGHRRKPVLSRLGQQPEKLTVVGVVKAAPAPAQHDDRNQTAPDLLRNPHLLLGAWRERSYPRGPGNRRQVILLHPRGAVRNDVGSVAVTVPDCVHYLRGDSGPRPAELDPHQAAGD